MLKNSYVILNGSLITFFSVGNACGLLKKNQTEQVLNGIFMDHVMPVLH